ncbi:hypothetical protein GQ44DRAFT_729367 [Phaeosphaeriaceae sp. PMI808]|nr:hypothetical protein GQ44DRAFT_729367 [Phaeosphaeriaceae sp. PMI808]
MQHTAMSSSQIRQESNQNIPPPSSSADLPLTSPLTDEKPFAQAPRVIALFHEIETRKHGSRGPWNEFQLVEGEYDKIMRLLNQDEELLGFVKHKLKYDYNAETYRLVVRLPTDVHKLFLGDLRDAISSQLKSIREGSDDAAAFARRVYSARSSEIYFPVENDSSGRKSKHDPDQSFWHERARYPGVIIEVAYSQKKKRLERLAEGYLLDSDANVQAVVGLDIGYGKKGLRLRLSDFAHEELVKKELGDQTREIHISGQQLCQFLTAAESMVQRAGTLHKSSLPPGVKKRRRSETPPEEIASDDEARFIEQERKVVKRMEALDFN